MTVLRALGLVTGLAAAGPTRPDLARLRGHWIIDFRPRSNPRSTVHRGVATLDLDVVTKPHRPQTVEGPYTLSMQGLTRPDPCLTLGGTARLVPAAADSIRVDLQQGFACGLYVIGRVRHDTLFGRWYQRSSSGPVARGTFTMTRKDPHGS